MQVVVTGLDGFTSAGLNPVSILVATTDHESVGTAKRTVVSRQLPPFHQGQRCGKAGRASTYRPWPPLTVLETGPCHTTTTWHRPAMDVKGRHGAGQTHARVCGDSPRAVAMAEQAACAEDLAVAILCMHSAGDRTRCVHTGCGGAGVSVPCRVVWLSMSLHGACETVGGSVSGVTVRAAPTAHPSGPWLTAACKGS